MARTETMINAFDASKASHLGQRTRDAIARRRALLGPMYRLLYEEPIEVARAEGVNIFGRDGEVYLDAYNNVPCIGHSHPRVTEAVTRQLALFNTNTRYINDTVLDYAERLIATFPAGLDHAMFTCSGSESVDLALRIARRKTGRRGMIVTDHAYHGNSSATSELSPSSGRAIPLGMDVRTIPAPSGGNDHATTLAFCASIEAAIDDLERHGIGFAGVLFDTIFSSDGVYLDPPGLLKAAAELVWRRGGVFIADEVQPGFARMGTGMWGFAAHGFVPDLVALGKPMGNGLPIGGVVAKASMVEEFGENARYFNTFGGNPVCIAAASAVLDVLEEEGLQDHAMRVGQHLAVGFRELASRFAQIGEVRGSGLYFGVDIRNAEDPTRPDRTEALRLVNALRRKNILISACGSNANVLKIRPPLCFSQEDADRLVDAVADIAAGTNG